MKTKEFMKEAENFYGKLNSWISEGTMPLTDMVYPNHDGQANAEAMADLMELRDRLSAILNGAEEGLDRINGLIKNQNDNNELPSNVVARLNYAAQALDTLELHPDASVDIKQELPYPVTYIRMAYPFKIEHKGSYNVYKISPAKTWGELLTETIKVFQREYKAGKNIAPHAIGDFIIERVDVHPNDLATIGIGS